jgi:hypothetical protein
MERLDLYRLHAMKLSTFLLSYLGVAALVDASPTPQNAATPFLGAGRLTALHDTDREYMGCITDAGLWTVDERQCGTFNGVSTDDYGGVHLSSALGICGVCNGCGLVFSCGKDGVETDFYVRVGAGVLILTPLDMDSGKLPSGSLHGRSCWCLLPCTIHISDRHRGSQHPTYRRTGQWQVDRVWLERNINISMYKAARHCIKGLTHECLRGLPQ